MYIWILISCNWVVNISVPQNHVFNHEDFINLMKRMQNSKLSLKIICLEV